MAVAIPDILGQCAIDDSAHDFSSKYELCVYLVDGNLCDKPETKTEGGREISHEDFTGHKFLQEKMIFFNPEDKSPNSLPGIHDIVNSLPPFKYRGEVRKEDDNLSSFILGIKGKQSPFDFLAGKVGEEIDVLTVGGPAKYMLSIKDLKSAPFTDLKSFMDFIHVPSGGTVNFLCDFLTINKEIAQLTDSPGISLNLNVIINRESGNDPGPSKGNNFPEIVGGAKIQKRVLLETNDAPEVIYSQNNPELFRNMFFSKFDIKLGGLIYKRERDGKITNLDCACNITGENGKRLFSSAEGMLNSINKCKRLMLQAFNAIKAAARSAAEFLGIFVPQKRNEIAVCYTAKRSGDWLQALSIKDKNRTYFALETGEIIQGLNGLTFLFTHDRLLLAYALFMGLNVIFTRNTRVPAPGREEVYAFINRQDLESNSDPKAIAQIIDAEYAKLHARHDEIAAYVRAYDSAFRAIIESHKARIAEAFEKIPADVNVEIPKSGQIDAALKYNRGASDAVKQWLREFWVIQSTDYTYWTPIMKQIDDLVKAIDIDKKKVVIQLYTSILHKMKELPDPNEINLIRFSYVTDSAYKNIIDLLDPARKSGGRAHTPSKAAAERGLNLESNTLERVIVTVQSLEKNLMQIEFGGGENFYEIFIQQLNQLHGRLKDKNVAMTTMLDTIKGTFDDETWQSIIAVVGVAAGGGGGGGGGAPPKEEVQWKAGDVYKKGKLSFILTQEDADYYNEEEQQEWNKFMKIYEEQKKRSIVSTFGSIGNFPEQAGLTVYKELAGGARAGSGGSVSKKSPNKQEIKHKFLYILYIYRLRKALIGIDSEDNFDHTYYVVLSAIVMATLELHQNYLDIVYCFYTALPKQLTDSALAFLSRKIGLLALNIFYSPTNLEETPHTGKIDVAEILARSGEIKRGLGSTYAKQREALLANLLGHISPNMAAETRRSVSRKKSASKSKSQSAKLSSRLAISFKKNRSKSVSDAEDPSVLPSRSKSLSENDPVMISRSRPGSQTYKKYSKSSKSSRSRSTAYKRTQRRSVKQSV